MMKKRFLSLALALVMCPSLVRTIPAEESDEPSTDIAAVFSVTNYVSRR